MGNNVAISVKSPSNSFDQIICSCSEIKPREITRMQNKLNAKKFTIAIFKREKYLSCYQFNKTKVRLKEKQNIGYGYQELPYII